MYNRWTFYGQSQELYHYGVLGMKWGVHKARYYQRKYDKYRTMSGTSAGSSAETASYRERANRYKKLLAETKKHLVSKSTEKLRKYDTQYKKRQSSADSEYARAQRRSYSFLSSQKRTDKSFERAAKRQYRANRTAYRGKQWYERMVKAYGQLNIKLDSESAKIGKEFVNRVEIQSKALYANSTKKKR